MVAAGTTVDVVCAFDPVAQPWTQAQVTRVCEVADVVGVELRRLDGRAA